MVKYPTKGAPQGAIASPYLWNDNYDSFMKIFENDPRITVDCYADDAVLLITGKNLVRMKDIMQSAIVKSERWAADHGLLFAASKTKAMVFTKKWAKSPKLSNGWVYPRKLKIFAP